MALHITYEVKGLSEIIGKLSAPEALIGPPLRKGLTTSALLVEGEAKKLISVDTGDSRRRITHRVDSAPIPTFALVGGSGIVLQIIHEGRRPGAKPPPPKALAGWASRHGIPASALFPLARAIGKKGIKGRPFLKQGLERARGGIDAALRTAAKDIEAAWGGR